MGRVKILSTTCLKPKYAVIILYFHDRNSRGSFTSYLIRTSAYNSYQHFKQEIMYGCIHTRMLTTVVVVLEIGHFYLRIKKPTQLGSTSRQTPLLL